MLIQVRRGLEAYRLSITPDMGEPLFTTDTKKLYIGDGATPGGIEVDLSGSPAPVQSVAGKTGTVTLVKSDVGLSNVDNTADLNKPISAAAQAALDAKATVAALTSHTSNTSNPHNTTKAQVGLPDVDNVSAAALRDRSTHTGTQPTSSVAGLDAALAGKQPAGSYATTTQLTDGLDDKADIVHTHAQIDVVGLGAALNAKQDDLVSGTNIKTINGESVLGSGDLVIAGGGGGAVDSVNGQTGVVVLDADDISDTSTTKKFATAAEKTKLGHISVTQAVDLDAVEAASHTHANAAVLNATTASFTTADETKLDGIAAGATVNDTDANLKARANHTGTQAASTISDFNSASDARIAAAAGVSVASLSGGKVPSSQLPAIAVTDVFTVASQVAQLALTAEEGDVAIRTDLNKSYVHNGGSAGTMADWSELLTPTDAVLSVNGETGAVTLTTDDISDAGQTNKWATTAEKTKLSNISVTQAVDLDTIETNASNVPGIKTKTDFISVTQAVNLDTMESDIAGKQASDADLTAIAGLSPTNDDIIQRKAGAWVNRTMVQLKTDLALTKSDVGLANVDNTTDLNKPVSTATQTALNAKLDDTQFSGLSKITVSTSAPGSPSVGDLWVDTN